MRAKLLGAGAAIVLLLCLHSDSPPNGGRDRISATPKAAHLNAVTLPSWNAGAAAAYLDRREKWWTKWPSATRDHDTFCVSCHTVVPYALARPALSAALNEPETTADEVKLWANLTKRVSLWNDEAPYYTDESYGSHKSAESRATESVLNALILANRDARTGQLGNDTRAAFDHMWSLQQTKGDAKGAWLWQQFDLEPWESSDSVYSGAALAAAAVGIAPDQYRASPAIQGNLALLREYLMRECPSQSLLNRLYLLWASTKVPGLLGPKQRESVINDALSAQKVDGGWSLTALVAPGGWNPLSLVRGWRREARTGNWGAQSDGFATGFVAFTLQEAGVPRDNAHLRDGLIWLTRNQDRDSGSWTAHSLNKRRDPAADAERFMSDAATAYAVLALTDPHHN